ncbi:MAG: hypothetical protein KDB36_13335 [Acidimicrobiales bacterium]|nr:hypothetical protein [Acidimicrobiales bacterium]
MDVVYVVRPGDDNEELRFSLRALAAHVPHDSVILVGYCPSWVTGVHHIPVRQTGTKYRNSTLNLLAACEHPAVDDEFVLFNDDMFAMAPVDEVPVLHRGPVVDVAAEYSARGAGRYLHGMLETAALLAARGVASPLSYELHVPLPVHKDAMAEALHIGLDSGIAVVHKRTLYGNLAGIGGELAADVKVCRGRPDWDPQQVWLSTSDTEFASWPVGAFIRSAFPAPGPYERSGG